MSKAELKLAEPKLAETKMAERKLVHSDIKPENPPERAAQYLDVPNMPWEATKFPGIRITDIAPVGRYAYHIVWSDGHDTGIFTLEHLRELCQCPACARKSQK